MFRNFLRLLAGAALLVSLSGFEACESDEKRQREAAITVGWDCQERGDSNDELACSASVTGLEIGALKTCSWDASFANPHVSTSSGSTCSHTFDYAQECADGDSLSVTARLEVTSGDDRYGPEEKRYSLCAGDDGGGEL